MEKMQRHKKLSEQGNPSREITVRNVLKVVILLVPNRTISRALSILEIIVPHGMSIVTKLA